MRFVKATKRRVGMLEGISLQNQFSIWQYPKKVFIEINGSTIEISRDKLKKFLGRP